MSAHPTPRPWPLAPLLRFLPEQLEQRERDGQPTYVVVGPAGHLARLVAARQGCSEATARRAIARAQAAGGATEREADVWACALGLVPEVVWPGWGAEAA